MLSFALARHQYVHACAGRKAGDCGWCKRIDPRAACTPETDRLSGTKACNLACKESERTRARERRRTLKHKLPRGTRTAPAPSPVQGNACRYEGREMRCALLASAARPTPASHPMAKKMAQSRRQVPAAEAGRRAGTATESGVAATSAAGQGNRGQGSRRRNQQRPEQRLLAHEAMALSVSAPS